MSEKEKLQLENECLMKYSKAQMIQKYIDELEENSKLSELWFKSQKENQKLENQQKQFIEFLENEKNIYPYDISDYTYEDIINTILSKYEDIIEK